MLDVREVISQTVKAAAITKIAHTRHREIEEMGLFRKSKQQKYPGKRFPQGEPPIMPPPPDPPYPKILGTGPSFSVGFPRAGDQLLALSKDTIPSQVARYIAALQTGTTKDWCKCEWEIHPDDRDVEENCCIYCGDKKGTHDKEGPCLRGDCDCEDFLPRRLRLKDNVPECPVHTKEGLILGFFEWAFGPANDDLMNNQKKNLTFKDLTFKERDER